MRIPFLLLGGLLASTLAIATEDPAEVIRRALKEAYPESQIGAIHPSKDIKGFYEVEAASDIVYSDPTGQRLILGSLVDAATKENLTARRWGELHPVKLESLPLDIAIKSVRGNGARTLVVFADPDCPYCQALEKQMVGLNDATIYTFLYPLENIHPGATEKVRQIWCSPQREQAWTQWMVRQTPAPGGNCDVPLAKLLELGQAHSIRSTPTIVLANGRRIEGDMPLANLERLLESVPKH